MKIVIGSRNPAKIKAVSAVFPNMNIIPMDVDSNVSEQPFSDEETRIGAMNRAKNCHRRYPTALCIGLEGGIMHINQDIFVCNWGALYTPDKKMITAGGARFSLPKEMIIPLKAGRELGEIMDEYTEKENIRQREGAVGIFTNGHVDRQSMFEHIMILLKGQLEFWSSNKSESL